MFRKSSIKNDELQRFVKAEFGTEINLVLDAPTRWNTLVDMFKQLLKIRECIDDTLIKIGADMKTPIHFFSEEYAWMENVVSILEPVQNCILAICTRDCTLEDAHCAIEVCLDEISNIDSAIANDLKENIISKVSERLSPLYNVSIFLENRKMFENPKYFKFPFRTQIIRDMSKLLRGNSKLYQDAINDANNNELIEIPNESTGKRKTTDSKSIFFEKMKAKKKQKTEINEDNLEKALQDEVQLYIKSNKRGDLLEKVRRICQTIRPTSIDCERAFSTAGYFCNKLRSKLADETLNGLCFLKSYFTVHYKND